MPDPKQRTARAPELSRLIRTAREINDHKPHYVAAQVISKANRFREPRVACLGLAFKANIDDLRESPAVDIVKEIALSLPDVEILVSEPYTSELPPQLAALPNLRLVSAEKAVETSDIVALLVDHDQFRAMNRSWLAGKVVYDTRGIWR